MVDRAVARARDREVVGKPKSKKPSAERRGVIADDARPYALLSNTARVYRHGFNRTEQHSAGHGRRQIRSYSLAEYGSIISVTADYETWLDEVASLDERDPGVRPAGAEELLREIFDRLGPIPAEDRIANVPIAPERPARRAERRRCLLVLPNRQAPSRGDRPTNTLSRAAVPNVL
jgi:hypothetical protein